jgi:hypothetical protein
MADEVYHQYSDFITNVLKSGNISNFKNNPSYCYVLEHCSESIGQAYLNEILTTTPISLRDIVEFCAINDSIGNPLRFKYRQIEVSPSSLRYIYQAHLALSHFKSVNDGTPVSIVEIGGGYGGLCLAVDYFNKYYNIPIQEYNIVDLGPAISLQALYLSKFALSIPTKFHSSDTYGSEIVKNSQTYLISNYAFSEITMYHQQKYIDILFPKIDHGFMTWNFIPVYNFGFPTTVTPEVPDTAGGSNRYVRF